MGNEQVIAIAFHEIDIITKEQIMLVKYNEDLEDWRLRLMEFVKHSEILEISAGARENLLQNVPDMRLTVSNSTVKDKKVEFKKKCRYDNKGYCKYLENCKYQHFAHLCDQYQKDGKCGAGQSCPFRHPRVCKYWKHDTQGCKRDKACKYMHQNHSSIDAKKSRKSEKEDVDMECMEEIVEVNDSINKNNEENNNKDQNIVELEMLIALKSETIKELKESEGNLKLENENTKEQAAKFQRVASNIYKELAELKSRKGK